MFYKNWQKGLIEANIPNFNFEEERGQREVQSAVRVAQKKDSKARKLSAFERAVAKGFQSGALIEDLDGQQAIVKKVTLDGHLVLEGRRGGFNICGWKVV